MHIGPEGHRSECIASGGESGEAVALFSADPQRATAVTEEGGYVISRQTVDLSKSCALLANGVPHDQGPVSADPEVPPQISCHGSYPEGKQACVEVKVIPEIHLTDIIAVHLVTCSGYPYMALTVRLYDVDLSTIERSGETAELNLVFFLQGGVVKRKAPACAEPVFAGVILGKGEDVT